ncbi:MAG: YkgJ family cysteine cluster protein [Deltaproteobacteria bacterium]|nr:YkgJ family cysteine cluster protein [Deltaproteobacteria bacterium]
MAIMTPEGVAATAAAPSSVASEVRAGLLKLHEKIDRFFEQVLARHRSRMRCAPGCVACCKHMPSVFPVEAWIIAHELRHDPDRVRLLERLLAPARQADEASPCPLLERGRCAVYALRPVICRSHGAPVKVPGRPLERFDVCPLNFDEQGARKLVTSEDVLDLERLNEILAVIDGMSRQAFPEGAALDLRMPLAKGVLYFLKTGF